MRKPRICVVYREYDAEFVYVLAKDVMQGKLFQKCRHLLYCNVLSLVGNVNKRWMLQPDMGSIFHIKNQ